MESEPIIIPYYWRRGFGAARLGVALVAVLYVVLAAPGSPWRLLPPVLAYAAFGAAVALRLGAGRPGLALLPLIADLAFFFLLVLITEPSAAWLPASVFGLAVLNAAIIRTWREVSLATACCALFLVVYPAQPALLAMAVLTTGLVALALSLYTALLRARLDTASRLSVLYRAHAENARDNERQRIAADIHDGPLQSFISFQMHLEILRKLMQRDTQAAEEELSQLQVICRGQVTELRSFVRAMRQAEEGSAGLATSIHRLVENFERDSGIPTSFSGAEIAGPEDPEVPLEVLQIVREALHNVQKHSKASCVSVVVSKCPGGIEIAIDDDGCGFPFSGSFGLRELDLLRLGPVSIKRRVAELNGDLTVKSHPGRGSGLKIRVPI